MNFLMKLFKGMYHLFVLPKPSVNEPKVERAVCDFDAKVIAAAYSEADPNAKGLTVEKLREAKKIFDGVDEQE